MKFTNEIPDFGLIPIAESVPNKAEDSNLSHGSCDDLQVERPISNTGAILFYASVLVLPITVLTTTFLALIYTHSINPDVGLVFQLQPSATTSDINHVYVAVKSSWLIFIISRTSTFAPFIAGLSASLVSFQVAQKLFRDTIFVNYANCLTPYQLAIAIKLLAGSSICGFVSIYKYMTGAKQRAAFATILRILIGITVISFALSIAIFVLDFWIHATTSTVNLERSSHLPLSDATYSLSLVEGCLHTNNSIVALKQANQTCTLRTDTIPLTFADPVITAQTLNNRSPLISVLTHTTDTTYSYLSVTPSQINASHDFTATTYGVRIDCRPISESCNLTMAFNTTYNCSNGAFAASGSSLNAQGLQTGCYRRHDLSDSGSQNQNMPYGINNPFYWTAAIESTASPALKATAANTTAIVINPNLNTELIATILLCSATVLNIEYDLVQSQIQRFTTTPASAATANVFNSAVAATAFGQSNLRSAIAVSAATASTVADLSSAFASALSTVLLSAGAGSVHRTPALAAQQRTPILATKLAKAPIYALFGVTLAFIVTGIVLAAFALATTEDARQAAMHLSVEGLVAALFEAPTSARLDGCAAALFDEFRDGDGGGTCRAGIDKTPEAAGGFEFMAIPPVEADGFEFMAIPPVEADGSLVQAPCLERRGTRRSRREAFAGLLALKGLKGGKAMCDV